MPRPASFSREQLVVAAATLAAREGPAAVTMQGVASAVGAPSGSVYHRFGSRAELLAEVWLSVASRFQADWWHDAATCERVADVAALPLWWARRHREEATLLISYRREEFVGDATPAPQQQRARTLRRTTATRLSVLTERFAGERSTAARRRTRFALTTLPLAALRGPLLYGSPITRADEELVREAASALLPRRRTR